MGNGRAAGAGRPAPGTRPCPEPDGKRGGLRVLVVLGHPRIDSLCGALAAAYADGARRAGAAVAELRLGELAFEPDVTAPAISAQPLEDDLLRAQGLIAWADHLVFVYPTWWGTMPALLKGFLDRVLTPGFAFADREDGGGGWDALLRGKTAELLTTMDTPRWVYRWIYGAPGHNAMRRAILGFCGVEVAAVTSFGPVKDSAPERRRAWLKAAAARGRGLGEGSALSARQRATRKLASWLRIVRFQFYPMTWLAYGLGTAAAAGLAGRFDPAAFWWGLACLFFLEFATVLANEYFDFETDRLNRNFGPFNGGSRMLAEGRLGFREVRHGIAATLTLAALCAAGLLAATAAPAAALAALLGMAVLALGYTVPPLRLCYRGLGELDVALTHSVGVILCGFVFQGGAWDLAYPWLLGLPLLLAVLPGIILAGVPDHDADRAAAKGTLAVRTGIEGAYLLAGATTVLAAAAAMALARTAALGDVFAGIHYGAVPHAALLLLLLARHARDGLAVRRIDGLMTVTLAYTVWFAVVPLVNLA